MANADSDNDRIDEDDLNRGVAPERLDELPATPFWPSLWAYVGPDRGRVLTAAVCSLVVGAAVAFQTLTIKWIIDEGILYKLPGGDLADGRTRLHRALLLTGFYVLMAGLRMSIWYIGHRGMIRAIEHLLCRLRGRFFRHVQGLCFRFHDQVSSGELFNYIMGSPVVSIRTFLSQFAMVVPYQLVSWTIAVTMLFKFNWVMTLITLGIIGIVVAINFRSRRKVKEVSADFMRTESEASKYVADMLRGCRAIKLHAAEGDVTANFEQHVNRIRDKGVDMSMRQKIESLKPEGVNYLGLAAIYAVGAWFVIFRDMQIGTFYAFIGTYGMLMSPLMTLLALNLIRANAEAGLDRINRILRVRQSTVELRPQDQTGVRTQVVRAREQHWPCVVFEDVHFAYDEHRSVFAGLSCEIRDGQSVALVGPSGSGKSTFISLLLRLYDPQQGNIHLNGIDIRNYSLQDLRSNFGVVPQDPFIFQATVLDNIRVSRPDATRADVLAACQTAYVTEFIADLPNGIDSWVGEGGSSLSGGQRQRLAIARAVLADPRYFIFDEATSALDNESERRVQAAMDELMRGRTTFIIAHRLSTVRNVDRVLVFERGRIVQDGAYADLAARPGLFRTLLENAGLDA